MLYHNNFIEYISFEKRYSEKTIEAYKNDLKSFQEYLQDEYEIDSFVGIDDSIIRSWFAFLIDVGYKETSLKRKKACLSSFYKYLCKIGITNKNSVKDIKIPKLPQRLPVFLTEEQINLLFEKDIYSLTSYDDILHRMILETFYAIGIRVSELIELKNSSFNYEMKTLKVIGKKNKERIIPLLPDFQGMLDFYNKCKEKTFDSNNPYDYYFLNKKGKKLYRVFVYRIIFSYLSKIVTLNKRSPHVMRHTFATHMLNNGAEINAIKELLGHKSLAATQLYTHNTIDKLKKVYNQSHPQSKKRRNNEY